MRLVGNDVKQALRGSRTGDRIVAYAWYGGQLAYPDPLPLSSYSFDWDIDRQIQTLSLEVDDKDGLLAPLLLQDPLGVGGAELQVRYDVAGTYPINMGWYRVGKNNPQEKWRTYLITNKGARHVDSRIPKDKDLLWVPGGSKITVTAYDRAAVAKRARLLAPESPPTGTGPTVVSEIQRLMKSVCAVTVSPAITDISVSPNLIYERDRLDAVQDLAKRIFADYRMTGDGLMELYPVFAQDPVATLEGGPDGLLVDIDTSQDWEGLYNQFVVDGTGTRGDGTTYPIRAIQQITSGPLSVYGPHGQVPQFYNSPMITDENAADAYALQMMQTQLAGLTVDLRVSIAPLPYLEQGDWVTVARPVVDGRTVPIVGKIKSLSLGGAKVPKEMVVVVQCSYWDVATAVSGVQRGAY